MKKLIFSLLAVAALAACKKEECPQYCGPIVEKVAPDIVRVRNPKSMNIQGFYVRREEWGAFKIGEQYCHAFEW